MSINQQTATTTNQHRFDLSARKHMTALLNHLQAMIPASLPSLLIIGHG